MVEYYYYYYLGELRLPKEEEEKTELYWHLSIVCCRRKEKKFQDLHYHHCCHKYRENSNLFVLADKYDARRVFSLEVILKCVEKSIDLTEEEK